MRRSICSLRKAAVIFIAVVSVVFAIFLVWHLVPGRIGQVATGGLLAVLALIVLPALTAAAWELERRAGHRTPDERDAAGERTAPHRRLHDGSEPRQVEHRRRVGSRQPVSRRPT
jgi:hypothetical protein